MVRYTVAVDSQCIPDFADHIDLGLVDKNMEISVVLAMRARSLGLQRTANSDSIQTVGVREVFVVYTSLDTVVDIAYYMLDYYVDSYSSVRETV